MPHNAHVLQRLSECCHLLNDEDKALHYITMACEMNTEDKELKWQSAIIKRQHEIKKKQLELNKHIIATSSNDLSLTLPQSVQVCF